MPSARQDLADFAHRLVAGGYTVGRDGNLSRRGDEEVLITVSGKPKESLTEEDVVEIGSPLRSSEWAVHAAIYRARPDVTAVIHAHPIHACVLAVRGEPLEPLLDEVTPVLGGRVEVARYAPSGSAELGEHAVAALGDRHAVILANHGTVTVGASLEEAFYRLQVMERAAQVQVLK
ncbi:MAG TPA: class II aldolase/adducin family protein [Candidatus Dormibacteraeota bacterium]|nr:class II aldolase/adducin family protein [Candidatus Dormibacteraeota bacterium]